MQISDFFVFILSNFPLSLNLELISITFDLHEFNVNLFASIQRWRFSSSVFASSCRAFLQMFDSSKQVSSTNSCTVERSNLKCKSLIYRGARRNFFRGVKRRIQDLLDKIKPHSCNQDFAKGFESKVNMTLFKKILQFGRMLSKRMQFKCIMDGGLGAKRPVVGQFSQFLEKNNQFNVI